MYLKKAKIMNIFTLFGIEILLLRIVIIIMIRKEAFWSLKKIKIDSELYETLKWTKLFKLIDLQ